MKENTGILTVVRLNQGYRIYFNLLIEGFENMEFWSRSKLERLAKSTVLQSPLITSRIGGFHGDPPMNSALKIGSET